MKNRLVELKYRVVENEHIPQPITQLLAFYLTRKLVFCR